MPQQSNAQTKNLQWLKAEVNKEINRQQKYFATLSEFAFAQFESPSEQPVHDPKLDFRMFLSDTVNHQVNAFSDKIFSLIKEFEVEASKGGKADA